MEDKKIVFCFEKLCSHDNELLVVAFYLFVSTLSASVFDWPSPRIPLPHPICSMRIIDPVFVFNFH